MIVKKEVNYDLECKNPPIIEIGSHELNIESFSLEISLYQNYKKLEFDSGDTVTAALVSGGILIDSERECTIDDNKVALDITNKKNETATVRAGRMLIELSIKTSTNEVYVLPTAFIVRVEKSILDDAVVTEDSVGSVADAVKQINDASGEYESLSARLLADYNAITLALANKLDNASGSVKTTNLDSGSVTTGKLAGLAVTAAKIANNTITADKLTDELRRQLPTITVWSYETSRANSFTVPTNYEGKIGDIVVVTAGTGSGGKMFVCARIVSAYGSSQYYWEEITLVSRVTALESTVGAIDSALQAIIDGGASNE